MSNECIVLYDDGDNVPMLATVGLTGKKCVSVSAPQDSTYNVFQAALPAAGGRIAGVAAYDVVTGVVVNIVRRGTSRLIPITCSAAITAGADLMVDTTGAVLPWTTGNTAIGKAWSTTTASGQDVIAELY
ncbi:capsid cement protein [Nocardia sp. NPDC059246]|uniref:capsid cement protein n=1 Tax=unclassified Nocardia TaxID=2637762 RepID=UPI0036985CE0